MELKYLDFDLAIERSGDRYRARVLNSPAGQASVEFSLPFTDQDLEILMLRVGRPRRGIRRLESQEMQAAKQFGGKLFEAVFAGDVRGVLRSSGDTAQRDGVGLRVRLRLTDAPELGDLPWEFLYNISLNRFIALSAKTPLVRYIDLPEPPRPLKITPPLRILVMISAPTDYESLDVEREWHNLNRALQDVTALGMVSLERLDSATLGALRRKLRQQPFHVLHFIGHGGFDSQAQDGVLILEDEQQRGRLTGGQYLGQVLTDHDSLRLVVLNACEGARTAPRDPFAGVAASLVQQGIPAVIAMQFEITDEAAIAFAHEFYTALADGYPVDAALGDARGAIFAQVNDLEWGTPVLYLRAPDGVIFAPLTEEEKLELARKQLEQEQRERDQPSSRDRAPQPVPPLGSEPPDDSNTQSPNRPISQEPAPSSQPPTPAQKFPTKYILPLLGVLALLLLILLSTQFLPGVFPGTVTPTQDLSKGVIELPTGLFPPSPLKDLTTSPTNASSVGPGAFTIENRGTDSALMVLIPEGDFLMGWEDGGTDEAPAHIVHLSDFWIDLYEVTNQQYKLCEDAGACSSHPDDSASRESYYGNSEYDHYPVIFVTWEQAAAYCEWAGKRLPTEAEWEKASRGTDARLFPWGNDYDPSRLNANGVNDDTTEAGNYAGGVSPYGIYDMAGNVHEWVSDWYSDSYYSESPSENPTGPDSGDRHVLRGGGWDSDASSVQSTYRGGDTPDFSSVDIGFRCAE